MSAVAAWLALVLVNPPPPGAVDEPRDLETALIALDSADSGAREQGERWLGRHLDPSQLLRLRVALIAAPWERVLRVENALVEAPRGVELCVRLAREDDSHARFAGRAALEARIARWSPGWDRGPDSRAEVMRSITGSSNAWIRLDLRAASGRVDLALDQLARFLPGSPPLVLEPGLTSSPRRDAARGVATPGPATGSFEMLLPQLARAHGVTVTGFAFDDDLQRDANRARPWILLRAADSEDAQSPMELVADWCLAADGAPPTSTVPSPPDRRAAAIALGTCGWPDASTWMESRWRSNAGPDRDLVWLDGLIAGAERDHIAPCLRERAEQAWMHAWIANSATDSALDRERVGAIARVLARIGRRASDGSDPADLARFPTLLDANPVATWAELVVWEGFGDALPVPADLARGLDASIATLGADELPRRAALLLQALRTRAALRLAAEGPTLVRPETIFEWGSRTGRLSALVRALRVARVSPPSRWSDPAALPNDWSFELRLAAAEWRLVASPVEAAARGWSDLLWRAQRDELVRCARVLARRVREGDGVRVRAVLARARELAGPPGAGGTTPENAGVVLARLEIALGTAAPDAVARARAELGSNPPTTIDAGWVLGVAAAGGDAAARAALIGALSDPKTLSAGRAGLDWAVDLARARLDDAAERELVLAVRAATREAPANVRAFFLPDAWPARPELEPLDLDELDRALPDDVR